jgi:hypothetical protein
MHRWLNCASSSQSADVRFINEDELIWAIVQTDMCMELTLPLLIAINGVTSQLNKVFE